MEMILRFTPEGYLSCSYGPVGFFSGFFFLP
jgi:hypothetical protein